jgi:hypothetical protein
VAKKGRHHTPGAVKRGKDIDLGIRFEAKFKKSKKRRAGEKAGRKASRRK